MHRLNAIWFARAATEDLAANAAEVDAKLGSLGEWIRVSHTNWYLWTDRPQAAVVAALDPLRKSVHDQFICHVEPILVLARELRMFDHCHHPLNEVSIFLPKRLAADRSAIFRQPRKLIDDAGGQHSMLRLVVPHAHDRTLRSSRDGALDQTRSVEANREAARAASVPTPLAQVVLLGRKARHKCAFPMG